MSLLVLKHWNPTEVDKCVCCLFYLFSQNIVYFSENVLPCLCLFQWKCIDIHIWFVFLWYVLILNKLALCVPRCVCCIRCCFSGSFTVLCGLSHFSSYFLLCIYLNVHGIFNPLFFLRNFDLIYVCGIFPSCAFFVYFFFHFHFCNSCYISNFANISRQPYLTWADSFKYILTNGFVLFKGTFLHFSTLKSWHRRNLFLSVAISLNMLLQK